MKTATRHHDALTNIKANAQQITADGWNQSLVDRLQQFKYADLWTAAAVHDCIGYSVMARDEHDKSVVLEILVSVMEQMPRNERNTLRAMSRESLKWSDRESKCIRDALHRIAAK